MTMVMKLKSHKGASAVEFALVLPLLIVLVFGIIEFGVFLFNKQVITNASREGARAGIVAGTARLTTSDITGIVDHYCADHLITFGDPNVPLTLTAIADPPAEGEEYEYNAFNGNPPAVEFGDNLKVMVTYLYEFLVLPNFITELAGEINLTAVTVMKYE